MVRRFFKGLGPTAVAAYLAATAVLLPNTSGLAKANELDTLHQQILQRPNDTALNMRFAQLAENGGYLRWALAAYERLVLADPNNTEALQGLMRVRRALQPTTTLLTLQWGTQYESNPSYYLTPRTPELQALGSASLLDERNLSGMRWRTNIVAAGLLHARQDDLTYGVAGFDTGPVLDVVPGWAFHPAVGASAAYFDHRFYYGEASIGGTFESNTSNMYRSVLIRGAYREYDQSFPTDRGFYVEARGRWAIANVFGTDAVAIVSPWVLWSDLSGAASVVTPIITELQPGAYIEWGGRVDWLKNLTNWVTLGLNVAVSQRDYRNDVVVASLEKRRDTIVSPGASLTFPNLIASQTDLRLEYRFIDDHSNDQTKSFTDHLVTATIISRFDPAVGPAWPQPKR
jgi:hypothetical protein